MSFKDFPDQHRGVELLQRSLERGRLGHGYLFVGHDLAELEALARTLAKTLNCLHPPRKGNAPIDCCDQCLSCRKIEHGNHADVHWVRPESKMRIVSVDQMRELMREIQLKPTEAEYKVAIIVAADRLKTEAANAFLKTLEEPPPKSILVLLTTDPQRILETIRSRCLRLQFAGDESRPLDPAQQQWLAAFSDLAAADQKSLLGRYRLLDVLLQKLNALKEKIDADLTARSPLQRYEDAEEELREKWEAELKAAIEAEYRRQRAELLVVLQRWLRDVWVAGLWGQHPAQAGVPPTADAGQGSGLLNFPQVAGTARVARRLSPAHAMENLQMMEQLQRWLGGNVQEAIALEVSLLKLHL